MEQKEKVQAKRTLVKTSGNAMVKQQNEEKVNVEIILLWTPQVD